MLKFFLAISLINVCLAADHVPCTLEDKSVINPKYNKCCEGLALKPAPIGTYGSAGTCVKDTTICIEKDKTVSSGPGSPPCCKGLNLKPAPQGAYGIAGTCVEGEIVPQKL
ncbi:MAG TPA: hypothetical protein VNJ08_04210 [Bacteriovoracaceae bacterium]|nr:hypothetical protein [Bacteriovoracaceae bacterium]